MKSTYDPNIPVVVVHPFYCAKTGNKDVDKSSPLERLKNHTYAERIIQLVRTHPIEIIVLEEGSELDRTKDILTKIRREKPIEFIETRNDSPIPEKGCPVLTNRLEELQAYKVGLVGGYYGGPEVGCLGFWESPITLDGFSPKIFDGLHFTIRDSQLKIQPTA